MRLFDTHAHLLDDQFELDRNALIASFPAAGVAGFVEACVEANDIPKIQGLTLLYASDAGKHITGQWMAVDGGVSALVGG